MKARWFVPFLLAATLAGHAVNAPWLREEIPRLEDARCDYDEALRNFYLAYAYAGERADLARKFLAAAEAERAGCEGDTSALARRIAELGAALR